MLETELSASESIDRATSIERSQSLLQTIAWALAAVIGVEYVVYFATLRTFPLQDFPNHLARATIMSDLLFDHGARFGAVYTLALQPVPYVLHDLLFATCVKLFGVQAGGACFVVF